MSWTAPRTWVVGEIVTAAQLNTHVRDNLSVVSRVSIGSYTGDGTTDRTITLAEGFTPAVVFLVNESGSLTDFFSWMSPITTAGTRGVSWRTAASPSADLEVQAQTRPVPTSGGFVVSGSAAGTTNVSGNTYRYVAFG